MADNTQQKRGTDNIGLFSQFGFTNKNEEQLLQEKETARVTAALANLPQQYSYAGEESLTKAGAFLGAKLLNRFSKPELSAEEKMQLAMKDFAAIGVKNKMEENPEWRAEATQNPQLIAIETMRQMSQFAFDSGDVTTAAELSAEAGRRYMEYRQQSLELTKLDEDVKGSRANRRRAQETHEKQMEDATQIIAPGPNGKYDIANIEDNIITGRYDKELGSFVDSEGNKVDNFITLEQAISLRELAQEEMEDAGVESPEDLPWDARVRLFDSAIPASERTGMRMQFDSLDTQSAIMNAIADRFIEMDRTGKQPGEFLDGAGQITQLVTNMKTAAINVGGTWRVQIAKGTDEEIAAGKGEALYNGPDDKNLVEEYANMIELPEGMDATGDAAAEYQSAIIQLAYAVARSNEPGARQLSDADFKNAIKEIGAAAASPERLRRVILANFARKTKQVRSSIDRSGEIAASVGLTPEEGMTRILGSKARKDRLERFEAVETRFDKLKGDLEVMELSRELDQQEVLAKPTFTGTGTPEDPIIIN